MHDQMHRTIVINGGSPSTLGNYLRSIARLSLYFNKLPLELEDNEINDYLLMLHQTQAPSYSYFKIAVYALRYLFRLYDRDDRAIRLPSIQRIKSLPVVLSKQECKALFKTPRLLKHRILLALIYSAGLRISEVHRLEQRDVDLDRMLIHIRKSKYKKDRCLPLSVYLKQGLQKYYAACCPDRWVFNGRPHEPLSQKGIQFVLRESVKKTAIQKPVTVHTLRHSYATHLLEDGLDIVTIKELLGHEHIATTMVYLQITPVQLHKAHSPLDSLYGFC